MQLHRERWRMLRNHDRTLTYVSLFSAAGVGCYGFTMEGFECVATNELISRRLNVQRANKKCRFDSGYIVGDATKPDVKEKVYSEVSRWQRLGNDRVDVVMATPPCQGISVINHKKNAGEIKRNSLVIESVEIIRHIKPRIFVFENVQAFWKTLCVTRDEEILPIGTFVQRELGKDYIISARVLNFMNYGSNSSRTRTLVIGIDKELRNQIVPYDLIPPYRKEPTLRDVIGRFAPLEWGEISTDDFYHAFRTYDTRMRIWIHGLQEGQSAFDNLDPKKRPHRLIGGEVVENIRKNRDKYTRQKWDRFVQCVHTRNDQLAAQNTVHPVEDRVFSLRELMEMMTIPRTFRWMEQSVEELNALPLTEKRKLYAKHEPNIRQCLGEAVPTEVIRQIAERIRAGLIKRPTAAQINKIIEEYHLDNETELCSFVEHNPRGLPLSALMRIAELCNSRREENEAFYTNEFIVNNIMDALPDFGKPSVRILEPSVGVGNFLPFLFKRYAGVPHVELDVMDIDETSLKLLRLFLEQMEVPQSFRINIVHDDYLIHTFDLKYDLVVGNPPFSKLKGDLEKYSVVLTRNINRETKDCSELFLEKSMDIGGFVALVLNKTLLATEEFAETRDLLRRSRIHSILDFGRYGFTGVSIETMCLMVEPKKTPSKTYVYNMKHNISRETDQYYITDRRFPCFLIYRDSAFDAVADRLDLGVFDVVRDRQITKRDLSSKNGPRTIRVIKARNITDDGTIVDVPNYDSYIEKEKAEKMSIYKFVGDRSVYLSPNMTYNPRVIRNTGDWIPDGSVAVLVPHEGVCLSDEQLAFFSSREYRAFYVVARNLSTQSINIDKTSVFFFGALRHD